MKTSPGQGSRRVTIPPTFKKRYKKKSDQLCDAIRKCVKRLGENPRHPSLQTHKIKGTNGIFEAYVDHSNRVTFRYGKEGEIVLLNHCNHDIIGRA